MEEQLKRIADSLEVIAASLTKNEDDLTGLILNYRLE